MTTKWTFNTTPAFQCAPSLKKKQKHVTLCGSQAPAASCQILASFMFSIVPTIVCVCVFVRVRARVRECLCARVWCLLYARAIRRTENRVYQNTCPIDTGFES